jgi:hypothetical protein
MRGAGAVLCAALCNIRRESESGGAGVWSRCALGAAWGCGRGAVGSMHSRAKYELPFGVGPHQQHG